MPGALVGLAEELQRRCTERGLTISVAESCTGGLVAATITEAPGSSDYFLGGVVSYANSAKERFLGVPASLLDDHGAVSAEAAIAMAEGARARFGSDLAAGITGVAGPGGGSETKPVGLVYVAVAVGPDRADVQARQLRLPGDRSAVRERSARVALEWLIEATGASAR